MISRWKSLSRNGSPTPTPRGITRYSLINRSRRAARAVGQPSNDSGGAWMVPFAPDFKVRLLLSVKCAVLQRFTLRG